LQVAACGNPAGAAGITGGVADSIEQIAYELSVHTLGEQERSVSGLRTRAGTVLAAASIASSFLGSRATTKLPDWSILGVHVGHGSLDVWSFLAVIAFLLTGGASVWILLPRRFVFAFEARTLLAASDEVAGGVEVADGYRALTLWMAPSINDNRRGIQSLNRWFVASCVALGVEIVLWTASLA
jgi:hypothetical protein